MPNFKISVSKDGKKYSIVYKADSERAARERVHKEWYSILSLEEVLNHWEIGNVFIFEWYKDWDFKHWKIVGNDIFKVYVKLRKNLEYDIHKIYSEKDESITDQDKENIIKELREEYDIFYSSWKKERIDELRDKIKESKQEKSKLESFYMKKELDDTNKLIEYILKKLELFLSWESWINIDSKKSDKLKIVYNEIIKLRKSTNISKLKEIWELALVKIWSIELQELEKDKNADNRKLLKETNKVLRKIGSKDQFIEKDRDISYQYNLFLSRIKLIFSEFKTKTKKHSIDEESHSYIKTLLYINKYKERYNDNTKYLILNFHKLIFNKSLREEKLLTRRVVRQNIILLKAKIKWVKYSYTFLKKWFNKFLEKILSFFKTIRSYLFAVIITYTFIFIFYLNFSSYIKLEDYNYDWIFYFLVIFLLYFVLYFSRTIFLLAINFVFLFFIVIFWVINF